MQTFAHQIYCFFTIKKNNVNTLFLHLHRKPTINRYEPNNDELLKSGLKTLKREV